MLRGYVTRAYEAVVPVQVFGPSGRMIEIEATVDTGFTGELTLPSALVMELELPLRDVANMRLAGDAPVRIPVYRATVIWDGQPQSVAVHCMEGTHWLACTCSRAPADHAGRAGRRGDD